MKEQYDALLKSYMCRKKVCWWHCRQVSEIAYPILPSMFDYIRSGCGARFCCYGSFAFERVYERPGAKTGRSVECVCLTKCGRRRRGRKSHHPGRYQEMFDVWAPWSIRFVDNKNVAKMLKAKGCKPLLWTRLIWFLEWYLYNIPFLLVVLLCFQTWSNWVCTCTMYILKDYVHCKC